jgi:nucleoside-diphosphate-sugar epimerase
MDDFGPSLKEMRVFLAGASGVIGLRLVPLLVAAGHDVAGMTRTAANVDRLAAPNRSYATPSIPTL